MKKFIKVMRVYRSNTYRIVLRKETIINKEHIVLIEKANNLVAIYLMNNEIVEVEMTLEQLQEELDK